jgi:hypothetical protein
MNQEKELDKLLKTALERRAADVPPLPEDFAERVLQKVEARRPDGRRPVALWVSGIAAALLVGFFLWPWEQTQQPGPAAPSVVAEFPKQEADTPVEPKEPAPQITPSSPITQNTPIIQKTPKTPNPQKPQKTLGNQPKPSKPIVPEEPQPEPLLAEAEPTLPSSSVEEQDELPVISPEKQALVDIFLAEEVLQVAYELHEQTEPLRAYIATLEGREPETSTQIVSF